MDGWMDGWMDGLLFNKKQTKKQKRYNLRTESLLSNNTSNCFEFIMTLTLGKTFDLGRRNRPITLPSGKSKNVANMLL